MPASPPPDHTTHPGSGGVAQALPRRRVRRQAPGELPPAATASRWTAHDTRLDRAGPVHVRKDGPNGKQIHWQAPDGSLGLGDHRVEDLIYIPSGSTEAEDPEAIL
jgi:hypothetical protein